MQIELLFNDETLKTKDITDKLSGLIAEQKISVDELVKYAEMAQDRVKATCIESLEHATKSHPEMMTNGAISFIINSLRAKAPRVKWESARVIGNCIHLFPGSIDEAVKNLLDNTEHEGTVVRWSAAYALSQILLLKATINSQLVPAAEAIIAREEKNSIRKIYLAALKKILPKKSSEKK